MLAAADAAEGKIEPPPELQMAWDAKEYGALPYKGARADQPAGLLKRMRTTSNIFDAFKAVHANSENMAEFRKSPQFKIYTDIMKLRGEHGAKPDADNH